MGIFRRSVSGHFQVIIFLIKETYYTYIDPKFIDFLLKDLNKESKMNFKKYPSIENSYDVKNIMFWKTVKPEIDTMKFMVTEKIDGANVQITFYPDGSLKTGRRNAYLEEGEKFFDLRGAIEESNDLMNLFKEEAKEKNVPILVFLELSGPGINNRVKYFNKLHLFVLDVVEIYENEEKWWNKEYLHDLIDRCCLTEHLSPWIVIGSLDAALYTNCDFNSLITKAEDNLAEGLIIEPVDPMFLGDGRRFILKKKSDKFAEKESNGSGDHAKKQELSESQLKYVTYINNNRVYSTFSKHGPIESVRQIGDYIKLVMKDAQEDFIKENPDMTYDRSTFSYGGNKIATFLKEYLEKGAISPSDESSSSVS